MRTSPARTGYTIVAIAMGLLLGKPAQADIVSATDTNPDPKIFEVYLTADEQDVTINGNTVHALVYRDDPPPPFVAAPAGIPSPQIVVNTGDLLIVHLKNLLDSENTSIHWHGIEVDNDSDGTGVAMDRIPPGGTYTYRFVADHPGITWYHPHMYPTHQAFAGMYGPLIIQDPRQAGLEAAGTIPTNVRTLVLSDINFDPATGDVGFEVMDPGPVFKNVNDMIHACAMSIQAGSPDRNNCNVQPGDTVLVNGENPNLAAKTPKIVARSGEGIRLRLINSSITRYFRLKVTGNVDTNLYRIGSEGSFLENVRLAGGMLDLWDTKYDKGEILLSVGDRDDVVVVPQGVDGDIIKIVGSHFQKDPLSDAEDWPEFDVLYIEIQGSEVTAFQIAEGDPVLGSGAIEDLKGLPITAHLLSPPGGIGSMNETITLTASPILGPSIDGVAGPFEDSGLDFTEQPFISTSRFAFVGDLLELTVKNDTLAHHPFHLHGTFFQPVRVLDALGNPLYTFAHNEFADTINIHNTQQLVFRLRYEDRSQVCDDPTNPTTCSSASFGGADGRWVYHCHILHHAALGMIAELVTAYATPSPASRTVTVSKSGGGAGSVTSTPHVLTCGDTCSASFPEGSAVTLTAAAEAGSYFAGFAGAADCADGTLAVTSDVTCTAMFILGTPTPTAAAGPGGAGVVDYLPNPMDLDGDGRGDAVRYLAQIGGAASFLGSATSSRPDSRSFSGSSVDLWSAGWTIKTADFDGDGRTDLFFYDEVVGSWFKGISTTPAGGPVSYSFTGGTWSPGWSVAVLELNGDNLSDVFLYNTTSGVWFRSTSTGDGTGGFSFVQGTWSPGWQIHPVRLNADGLTDLMLYNVATGFWFRAVNDGGSDFTFVGGTWSPDWDITPGDYNGDGLTDLFYYNVTRGDWYVGMNTGTGWTFTKGYFSPSWTVRNGDFNGDGRTDLFLYNVITGQWFESFADGAGFWTHVSGSWSPGWRIEVTSYNLDALADVLLYNPLTGMYFQAESTGPGAFDYLSGHWGAGQTIIATRP